MVRNITGPQSALTDFLATHNISANQIRQDAEQRRAAAAEQNAQITDEQESSNDTADVSADATADTGLETTSEAGPSSASRSGRTRRNETKAQEEKRKKQEKQAIEKIKASKAFKKRARDADDDEDLEEIARALFEERSAPMPGQMDNCDICEKRFTVTPYSRAGPNGGLLCAQCSKEAGKKDGPPKKKIRKSGGVGKRRNVQSRIFEGSYHTGAKSLMTLCIEMLAKNVSLADDLGELPDPVIDKIARLFSKRRLLRSPSLSLFVRASTERVSVYDGAYLTSDDLMSVFQTCSQLKEFKIRNAIQFKDEVMDYLVSRNIKLEKFSLHGANLMGADRWIKFLEAKGAYLRTLQVYYTDKHFNDDVVAKLGTSCPNLSRLKISGNQELTSDGVKKLADVKSLKHLSLRLEQRPSPKMIAHVIRAVGQGLETLSLKQVNNVNDEVLTAIKESCVALEKLRITDSEHMTDEGFVNLFTDWTNRPLRFIDFEACRHLDAQSARENPDKIGLCSDGFKAMMAHSRKDLRKLNIASCRHVNKAAFEEAFAEDKVYPELDMMDVSFCEEVDDFVLRCIFRSCPALHQVKVFGCMKVTSNILPRPGVILIGVPNALGVERIG